MFPLLRQTTASNGLAAAPTSSPPDMWPRLVDMGSDDYLWRLKGYSISARFPECYIGPEFFKLAVGEQKRRLEMYEKRRSDECWFLWRAWGRSVRWSVLKGLGFHPW